MCRRLIGQMHGARYPAVEVIVLASEAVAYLTSVLRLDWAREPNPWPFNYLMVYISDDAMTPIIKHLQLTKLLNWVCNVNLYSIVLHMHKYSRFTHGTRFYLEAPRSFGISASKSIELIRIRFMAFRVIEILFILALIFQLYVAVK